MQISSIPGLAGSLPASADAQQRQVTRLPNGQSDALTPSGNANAADPSVANHDQTSLSDAVKKLNDTVSLFNSSLQFSIDKDTDTPVVKVVDKSTDEVIRQIPSEEALTIAKAIDQFKGLLIKDRA